MDSARWNKGLRGVTRVSERKSTIMAMVNAYQSRETGLTNVIAYAKIRIDTNISLMYKEC